MKRLLQVVFVMFVGASCATGPAKKEAKEPEPALAKEGAAAQERAPEGEIPSTAHELLDQVVMSNPALSELWVRESQGLKEHSLTIDDKDGASYQLSVLAASAPEQKRLNETHEQIVVDVGSGAPLTCTFSTQRVDVAGTLRQVVDSFGVAPEKQLPAAVNMDVISGAPLIWMDVGYILEQAGEMRMGDVKVYMISLPFGAYWCVHDQMGYRQTALKSVQTMASSLMKSSEAMFSDNVLRRHVAIMYMSGQAMGFSEEKVLKTEAGLQTLDNTVTFIARGPGAYAAEDSYETELADKDGIVASQKAVTIENGDITLDMALERAEDGRYKASGTVQGKAVEFDLGGDHKIFGTYLEEETLRKFTAENQDGATMTLYSYAAGMAPDQIIPIRIDLLDAKERQLKSDMMGLEMLSWADDRGRATKSTADLGAFKIEIELKYAHPDK